MSQRDVVHTLKMFSVRTRCVADVNTLYCTVLYASHRCIVCMP